MNAKPADVEAYLSSLPEDARATLETLRRQIHAIAPDAIEVISYSLPAFRYRGRILVYLGAASKHCALYGMAAVIEAHQAELAAYDTSKGTIRFPPGKPPPETLVRRLIEAQIDEIEAAAAARKRRSKARADD